MTRNWPSILSTFLRALGPLEAGDADDVAVHAVLVALCRATKATGEIDLAELATACIACDGAAAEGRDEAGDARNCIDREARS